MKIELKSTGEPLSYQGINDNGNTVNLASGNKGIRPMESVLMAVAACSVIDIEMILKKMRQDFSKIEVEVEGKRREEVPRVFTHIDILYKIYGDVKSEKADQAVSLSMEKYCSVTMMLKETVEITYKFEIHK